MENVTLYLAEQHGVEGNGGSHKGGAERAERAEDEVLISGGSMHLTGASTLLANIAQEHASKPMTTH